MRKIYSELARLEQIEKTKVDLLIICGDFQAIRDQQDLRSLACPPKYRQMGDFHLYHSGKLQAPVPTLFIGGNHEASNYLSELYHGGWVCPNIYFLGYSGVIQFGGVRIGGISGIYNEHHYDLGYYERPPYDNSTMRSIYHYRLLETFKLSQLSKTDPLDIFLSHEWPTGIYLYGDKTRPLKQKPYFKDEVNSNTLGAKPLEELLFKLKPKNWFSAHMHVHFEAQVPHPATGSGPSLMTHFMALDKCLPRRTFLQIVDIDGKPGCKPEFSYDPEWLGIVKAADPVMNMERRPFRLPTALDAHPVELADYAVPLDFAPTVNALSNPQTDVFCRLLGIPNRMSRVTKPVEQISTNPEEIDLGL